MSTKRLPAWMAELDLRSSLLCWLSAAQSRYETALIDQFGSRFSARQIRTELRALQNEKHIDLAEFDRVRWSVGVSGRNLAARARERAKRAVAA
jgi:hypothetical protein